MKIAILRVRGTVRREHDVRKVFETFGLNQKNHCTIVEDSPHVQGMLKIIAPFATWGPVEEKVLGQLKSKDKIIRLSPPKKGYGRKGVKVPYKKGGTCGNRGEKINELLMRMV